MKRFFSIALMTMLLLSMIAPAAMAAHTPVFTWRVRGDANYEQWIYDGDDPIARFEMGTLDEPMQALMMFSAVPRPILLRDLKLTPGGEPLVEAVQLYWKTGKVITDVLDGLEVSGRGTDRLTVTFTVRDPWDTITVTRVLTVTYDDELESYVYDFRDNTVIHKPESIISGSSVRFEYCDPWFNDCPAPSQRFPGMWKGRYSKFAYETPDGTVMACPHHHVSNSQKGGIRLKPDGLFACVYEPDGNPAIQVMGGTSSKTSISICPWAYDVHMAYTAGVDELFDPITTHFRIFQCPQERAYELDTAARIKQLRPDELDGWREYPMYEPTSSFEKSMSAVEPRSGDLDPWYWRPMDEPGAVWDKTSGRTDSHSLKIEKDTDGMATWYSMCEGQGYFALPWTPCKGYEVSCWVKTSNVGGEGSSIGIRYHVPNIPPEWPIVRSERVTGTTDWKKVTVRIGPPPEDTSIVSLHLSQVGGGTTWFDDLEVKMLR